MTAYNFHELPEKILKSGKHEIYKEIQFLWLSIHEIKNASDTETKKEVNDKDRLKSNQRSHHFQGP